MSLIAYDNYAFIINQSVNWDVLIPLLNIKPIKTHIDTRSFRTVVVLSVHSLMPRVRRVRLETRRGTSRGRSMRLAAAARIECLYEHLCWSCSEHMVGGHKTRVGKRGSPLVHRALDTQLGHILSDLGRVQHEWYVEHFALEKQVGRRLDLKGEKHCESSDCEDFL